MTTSKYAITEDGQLLLPDSQGKLPPNLPEVLGFAFTTAPAAYDYWYTHTVVADIGGHERDGKWRLVAYTDTSRFEDGQKSRYGSGFHAAFDVKDDARRKLFELPELNTLLEGL